MNLALVPKQQKRDYNEDAKALTLPDPSNDDELYWKPFAIFARERKEELHAQIRLALLSSGNDAIQPPDVASAGDGLSHNDKGSGITIPAAILSVVSSLSSDPEAKR